MAKIYISSTFEDLKDYRAAAYRTLRQMQHETKQSLGHRPSDINM